MASAKITTTAFYRHMINDDDDLFSGLTPPEGLDKDVLVNNILMASAPFEVVYSDPYVMRDMIGVWSDAHQVMWSKWAMTWDQASEFNPLENKDYVEHEEIKNSGTDINGNTQTRNLTGSDNRTANLNELETRNLAGSDNRTANLSNAETKDLTQLDTKNLTEAETRNLVDTTTVSAYDSSAWSNKQKDDHTGTRSVGTTGTDTIKNTGTDTTLLTGTDNHATTDTGTVNRATTGTDNHATTDAGTITDSGAITHGHRIDRDAHYHGNIGITSLSTLLREFSQTAEEWDTYALITQQFLQEFCILVY